MLRFFSVYIISRHQTGLPSSTCIQSVTATKHLPPSLCDEYVTSGNHNTAQQLPHTRAQKTFSTMYSHTEQHKDRCQLTELAAYRTFTEKHKACMSDWSNMHECFCGCMQVNSVKEEREHMHEVKVNRWCAHAKLGTNLKEEKQVTCKSELHEFEVKFRQKLRKTCKPKVRHWKSKSKILS
eukprot:Gb_28557 [translate_table: standard]